MYQRTEIDDRKDAADIRITAAERNGYSIHSKISLSGRGIKSYGNGNYSVTEAAMAKLQQQHSWMPDF